MSRMLRYFLIIAIAVYFALIIHLLKREKFMMRYGILWLFGGLVMFIFTVFPELLVDLTGLLGVQVASNGLFAISIFLIIMMLVFLTAVVTELTSRIRKMAQKAAIMEKRLRDLENLKKDSVDNYGKRLSDGCRK